MLTFHGQMSAEVQLPFVTANTEPAAAAGTSSASVAVSLI